MMSDSPRPDYLKFTAVEGKAISVKLSTMGKINNASIEISVNGAKFVSYELGSDINLNQGECVEFRRTPGSVATVLSESTSSYCFFRTTGVIQCSGNVMSLLDASCESVSVGNYGFVNLFIDNTSLISAPYVGAKIFGTEAMQSMFSGCSNIVSHRFASINASSSLFGRNNRCASFTCEEETPQGLQESTLSGLPPDCIIYVPAASVDSYKSANRWSDRADYIEGF